MTGMVKRIAEFIAGNGRVIKGLSDDESDMITEIS